MPKYPRGKIRADDEGEAKLALVIQGDALLMIFGAPVTWLGFGIADAERLIAGLQEKVDQLKKGQA